LKPLFIVSLLLIVSHLAFSQSISIDYKDVGEVNYHKSITLAHQYESIPYTVSIYLWDLQKNETLLLKEEFIKTAHWKYKSFDVTNFKTGSYKFIVGFGKDLSKEIEFFVWNKQ
jgi:hypothetical protein